MGIVIKTFDFAVRSYLKNGPRKHQFASAVLLTHPRFMIRRRAIIRWEKCRGASQELQVREEARNA